MGERQEGRKEGRREGSEGLKVNKSLLHLDTEDKERNSKYISSQLLYPLITDYNLLMVRQLVWSRDKELEVHPSQFELQGVNSTTDFSTDFSTEFC